MGEERDQVELGDGSFSVVDGGYYIPEDPMDSLQCESCQ